MRGNAPLDSSGAVHISSKDMYRGSLVELMTFLNKDVGLEKADFSITIQPIQEEGENWNLYSRIECDKKEKERVQILEQNTIPIFQNLTTFQKDQLVFATRDHLIRQRLYDNPDNANGILQNIIPCPNLPEYWTMPAMIVGKPLILPKHYRAVPERMMDAIEIDLMNYESETIPEETLLFLKNGTQSEGACAFAPLQFIALYSPAVFDDMGGVYMGNMLEEVFKQNKDLMELQLKHGWLIMALQPDCILNVGITHSPVQALKVINEATAEFVMPYYEQSELLSSVDQTMANIKNSDPLDPKYFSAEKAHIFDCLTGQMPHKEDFVRPGLRLGTKHAILTLN